MKIRTPFEQMIYDATYKAAYEKYTTIKGGDGSGNFGHAGRPGEVGGSGDGIGGRASETVEINKFWARQNAKLVDKWSGERAAIGNMAISQIISGRGDFGVPIGLGLVNPDTGDLVGISSYEILSADDFPLDDPIQSGDYIHISYLSTSESGWGRSFMQQIINEAKNKGYGVALLATPSSFGFYEALGLNNVNGSPFFYLSPNEVTGLATKSSYIYKNRIEPENGVFVNGGLKKSTRK